MASSTVHQVMRERCRFSGHGLLSWCATLELPSRAELDRGSVKAKFEPVHLERAVQVASEPTCLVTGMNIGIGKIKYMVVLNYIQAPWHLRLLVGGCYDFDFHKILMWRFLSLCPAVGAANRMSGPGVCGSAAHPILVLHSDKFG